MFVVWVWKDSSLSYSDVGSTSPLRPASRRVAQASDFAGITNTAGAPSFAQFAKGGTTNACVTGFVRKGQRLASAASYPPLQRTQEPALSKVEGTGTLSKMAQTRIHPRRVGYACRCCRIKVRGWPTQRDVRCVGKGKDPSLSYSDIGSTSPHTSRLKPKPA